MPQLLTITTDQLASVAHDGSQIMQLMSEKVDMAGIQEYFRNLASETNATQTSNVGDIGRVPNMSNAQLRNPIQNEFPVVDWLMSTAASQQMRAARGLAHPFKDVDGEWTLLLPYTVGTLPPADTSGACCWVPLDIAKCGGTVKLKLLCLKDCDNIFDNLVNQTRVAGAQDFTNYFLRPGETVKAARERMALMSMAWFTARNIMMGFDNAGTDTLKPFHGLYQVMENPAVINIHGSSILEAFDKLYCRLQVLGTGDFVFAVHPLVYQGIDAMIVPGRWNTLPQGWTRNGTELRFHNIRFIQDKNMPINMVNASGTVFLLEGNSTGVYMGTDLMPTQSFRRHGFTSTDDPAQGCASECDFYYNYGAAFNTNPNRLAVISDVPIDLACAGDTLFGLEGLIQPDTLVPMV